MMTSQQPRKQQLTGQRCSVSFKETQRKTAIPQPQSDSWVQLLQPESFSHFCHNEALLLCQISNWEWVAWIPDYGEAIVNINQFYKENPTAVIE